MYQLRFQFLVSGKLVDKQSRLSPTESATEAFCLAGQLVEENAEGIYGVRDRSLYYVVKVEG